MKRLEKILGNTARQRRKTGFQITVETKIELEGSTLKLMTKKCANTLPED